MQIRNRLVVMALGIALAGSCQAGDTLRVGSRVLVVGDSATHVLDLLGQPVYREPAENLYGARYGDRWQYRQDSHVITVLIVDGKVAAIEDRTS